MITIVAVNSTGMFSYGWMPTIQLDNAGRVFLRGINEDNGGSCGSGKSSLLNSIKEILFAKNDSGKSGANVVNRHIDWKDGMFGVVWLKDHQDKVWRVMSIRSWKFGTPDFIAVDGKSQILEYGQEYKGTDLYIEWWDGSCWIDARPTASKDNKSMTDAQQFVYNEVLQMSYEQFSAYVCLGQSAESALVSGTSGKREKVIQAVADVSIWSKAADIAKDTYNHKMTEQNNLEYEISGMESVLETISIPNDNEIESAKKAVETIKNDEMKLKQELEEINKKLLEAYQNKSILKVDGIDQEIDILRAEEQHAIERYNNAISIEEDEEIQQLRDEYNNKNIMLSIEKSKLSRHDNLGEGECETCGQAITNEYITLHREHIVNYINTLNYEMESINNNLEAALERHKNYVDQVEHEAKIKFNEEMHNIKKSVNDLENRKQQAQAIDNNINNLTVQYNTLQQQISTQPEAINRAEEHLNYLLSRVQEKQQVEIKLESIRKNYTSILNEIEHLKWTERNLKKMRIQEYESAILRLNQLLADRLWEMWGAGLQARFVTASSTTRGNKIKSGLEFLIDTPKKSGIPIELYSGGETKTLIVAMFEAMVELAIERGSGVNIAAIDEIDEHLDDYRTDRLVDAVNAVSSKVSTCLIISHNKRLLNTMDFDSIWTVRKKDEFSTIEFTSNIEMAA